MKMKFVFIMLGLLSLTACMHHATGGGVASTENQNAEFMRASVQRTACFGICPVYQVSVSANGQVAYYGERDVAVTGKHMATMSNAAALTELWNMLATANFMQLPDFVPSEPSCGTVTTDMPTVILTASRSGKSHQVRYYTGCSDAPESLAAIADQIDKAANSARWIENKQSM